MAELTREDLRQHCIRTIENNKKMAEHFGFELENHKGYQEHNMVLELIEKTDKLEKVEQIIDDMLNTCRSDEYHNEGYKIMLLQLETLNKIEHIVKG